MFHFNRKSNSIQTFLCLSLVAFASATVSAATVIDDGDVEVTATASKNTVGVADPFNVTIEAVAAEGITVRFPEIGDQIGDFEVTGHRDTLDVPDPEGRKFQRQLTLETLKTGELNVPGFEIFFKDLQDPDAVMASVKTAAIPIAVQTSIADSENPSEFRDIKNVVFLDEPAAASSMPWGIVATIGGLGIAGVGGFFGLRRFFKRLTPKQRALQSLDQLFASGLLLRQDSKLVYESATQILRTFIESQFDFPATRQTTDEFLVAVKSDRRLSLQLQQQLKQFLESADMVKFAGLSCSPEVLKSAIDNARQFVLQADDQRIAAAKQQRSESTKTQEQVDKTFVIPASNKISASAGAADINNAQSSSLQKETV